MKNDSDIIVIYLGKGGLSYPYDIIKTLVQLNLNIECVLSEYIDTYFQFKILEKEYSNLKIIFIKTYKTKFQFFIRSINIFLFLRISNIINKSKAKVVYIPMISLWSAILCKFIKRKDIITTIHDLKIHKGEENIFMSVLFSYNIRKSNKIIVLTKSFIPLIMSKYNIDEKNICWIPHANYNYYIPEKHEKEIKNNTIFNKIIYFGRIYKYKGIEILLKSMEIIVNMNDKLILKIVGRGEFSETEKKLIRKMGNRVELINRWISDNEIHSFFDDIDFTVLPYIEASQSGVIMLSYSMKKPVIVTDVGGLPEQVLQSTGIIIPPNDEKILAKTILDFYTTPEKIFKMGINAYNYATYELTWENSAKRIIEFIQK